MKKSLASLFSLFMTLMFIFTSVAVPFPVSADTSVTEEFDAAAELAKLGYRQTEGVEPVVHDFSSESSEENINNSDSYTTSGTADVSAGALLFTPTAKNNKLYYKMFSNETYNMTSKLIEFDTVTNDSSQYYFIINYYKNVNNESVTNAYLVTNSGQNVKNHFDVLLDYESSSYKIWRDGDLMIESDFKNKEKKSDYIEFYAGNVLSGNKLIIDNLKVTHLTNIFQEFGITSSLINNGSDDLEAAGHLYLPKTSPTGSYEVNWSNVDRNINVDRENELGRLNGSRTEQSTGTVTAKMTIDETTYTRSYSYVLPINTLPEIGESIYDLKFDYADTSDAATILSTLGSDHTNYNTGTGFNANDMEFKDKKLLIKASEENQIHVMTFPIDSLYTDRLVYEFDIARSAETSNVILSIPGGLTNTTNKYTKILIDFDENAIKGDISTSPTEGYSVTTFTAKSNYTKTNVPTHVVIEFTKRAENEPTIFTKENGTINSDYKWSMWIDGVQVEVDGETRFDLKNAIEDLSSSACRWNFRTAANGVDIILDNIKVYQAKADIDPDVKELVSAIEADNTLITPNLDNGAAINALGVADANGCTITYEGNYILADGKISSMPDYDTDVNVKLTISKNDYSETITVPVKVAGKLYIGDITHENANIIVGKNKSSLLAYKRADDALYSKIFAAVAYYQGGEMIAISPMEITLASMDAENKTTDFECTLTNNTSVTRKVFVFDSLSNLKPLKKN